MWNQGRNENPTCPCMNDSTSYTCTCNQWFPKLIESGSQSLLTLKTGYIKIGCSVQGLVAEVKDTAANG